MTLVRHKSDNGRRDGSNVYLKCIEQFDRCLIACQLIVFLVQQCLYCLISFKQNVTLMG